VFEVIDALEALGADADLADASPGRLDEMLQSAGVEPAVRAALLAGDAATLQTLARAPLSRCILIHPAEEEEEPEEEEEEEEAEDDIDDDDIDPRKGPKPRGS